MMFCANCGKELKEGVKFCIHCGKATVEDNVTEKIEESYDLEVNKTKKSSTKIVIIGLILVMVLLIGGIYYAEAVWGPNAQYKNALALIEDEEYEEAITILKTLGDYEDAKEQIKLAKYSQATTYFENGDYKNAVPLLNELGEYSNAKEIKREVIRTLCSMNTIDTSGYHIVAVKSDGTVVAVGRNNDFQCEVEEWTDIIAVAAGYNYTIGLKSDGTVVSTESTDDNKDEVEYWTDIIKIDTDYGSKIGLKVDGTVMSSDGYGSVTEWKDIVDISIGDFFEVGLRSDGTVVTTGPDRQCEKDVESWSNIIAIAAGDDYIVGLKSDRTLVATGESIGEQCVINGWTNIIAIDSGSDYIVGLKADGTVLIADLSKYSWNNDLYVAESWTDIVAISAGNWAMGQLVGLKADGTVVITHDAMNLDSPIDFASINNWTDILIPE